MGPARPATHDPEEDVLSIVLAAQHDQHNDGSLTSFEEVTLLAVLVSADDPDQDGTEPVTIIIGDPAGGADGDLPSPAPDSEAACSTIVQSFITPDADVVITNTTLSVPLPAAPQLGLRLASRRGPPSTPPTRPRICAPSRPPTSRSTHR